MKKFLIALVVAVLSTRPVLADWTGKDASGSIITFKNAGACTSVVCVPVAQPVDATGASFGVTGNPFFVTNNGTFATQANAGTNLNTSLLALEAGGNLAGLVTQLGAVTASPTANTIADRLKTINASIIAGTVTLGGATPANSVPTVGAGFSFSNIATATTTTIKSGAGVLHSVCVNTITAASTAQMYDNTAGSGTKIGLITQATGQQPSCLVYDIAFATGLTIVTTTGTPDYTVSYR